MNFEMTHTKKFRSTAAAIFWMMEREKRGEHAGKFEAFTRGDSYPCQPIDLKKIIYRLVRENKLTVKHVTALRFIGSRGERPETTPHTKQICGLWDYALDILGPELVRAGIVERKRELA